MSGLLKFSTLASFPFTLLCQLLRPNPSLFTPTYASRFIADSGNYRLVLLLATPVVLSQHLCSFNARRIRKVFKNGMIVGYAGTGTQGLSDGDATTVAQFHTLRGLACDAAGNVFVADANRYGPIHHFHVMQSCSCR